MVVVAAEGESGSDTDRFASNIRRVTLTLHEKSVIRTIHNVVQANIMTNETRNCRRRHSRRQRPKIASEIDGNAREKLKALLLLMEYKKVCFPS